MSVAELVQLYAPLAGLLGLAFCSGVLFNQVASLKSGSDALRTDLDDVQKAMASPNLNVERLVRVETKVDAIGPRLDAVDRTLQGMQRMVANSMKSGTI